jgi:glycosyltransferase involved in cell wall biosynthesis
VSGGRAWGGRPKLLHVSIGGPILRSFFAGQLAYMQAQGFEVVIAAEGGPDLDALCRSEGVRGWNVPVIRPLRPWHDLKTLRALRRVIDEERPDIVHGHTPKGLLLGLLGASLEGVPRRICHLRSLPLETRSGPGRWLLHGCELLVAAISTDVFAISPSLAVAYRRLPGLRQAPVTVIAGGSGNGVDARGRFDPQRIAPADLAAFRARLGLPEDARVLCYVGRLAREKGIGELAAAWAVLRERDPDLRLLLAGRLDEREPVAADVLAMLAADPRVCLPGYVYERELAFALATVHILPTWREGFGTVLLEAAAMGVPAVASRVTGCIDAVVDGVTGTLVAPRSAPALVEALGRYLDDPDLRAAHGRAARRRALAEFAPERVWQELARRYRGPAAKADPQAALSSARVSDQPARQR